MRKHIGLANVYVLRYEATRADLAPDRAALEQAMFHARDACRLKPTSGDAWSTLEPRDFGHHLRLAYVSWGSECLRATDQVLSRYPGSAQAQWFAARVYIARGTPDAALEHLRAGCALQDDQRAGGRLATVGPHWLHGLVLAAEGNEKAAHDELSRELACEQSGHIYSRESCANSCHVGSGGGVREGASRVLSGVLGRRALLRRRRGGGGPARRARGRQSVLGAGGQACQARGACRAGLASGGGGEHGMGETFDAIRMLDVVVKNQLRDDPVTMAVWERNRCGAGAM